MKDRADYLHAKKIEDFVVSLTNTHLVLAYAILIVWIVICSDFFRQFILE